MPDTRRTTRSMSTLGGASPAPSVLQSANTSGSGAGATQPTGCRQGPTTRLRAAKETAAAGLQTRKRTRATAASSSAGQVEQQREKQRQPAKKQCLSVRQLALTVLKDPTVPQAEQRLIPLLEGLVAAEHLPDKHWRYFAAVYKIADEAPAPLLQALLQQQQQQHVLLHILQTMHNRQHQFIAQNAAVTVLVLLRAVASSTAPSSAQPPGHMGAQAFLMPLLCALLTRQREGLLLLLQAMHSSCRVIRAVATTSVSVFVQAVQTSASPSAAEQLVDALLDQQQQGLSLILQALYNESRPEPTASSEQALRCLALAAPQKLLAALLSQQQRRNLQLVLRALDSSNVETAFCVRAALEVMSRSAQGQQRQQLIVVLMRALQHGSFSAGHVLMSIAQTEHGPAQMAKHVKVLMQLAPAQGPCQTLVAAVLWTVAHSNDQAVVALAANDPTPLLQAMLQGGDQAILIAGVICLLALSDAGKRALVPRVPELLALSQPHHNSMVASMAMRTIGIMSAAEAWAQAAVLNNIDGVLDVLLQQQHVEAATAAGNTVLNLVLLQPGLDRLSNPRRIEALLKVIQQRGPCAMHAARALAHLANGRQRIVAAQLQHPRHLEVIDDMQELVVGLLLADVEFLADPFQAYVQLAPVYWMTVAVAACKMVPGYIGQLVQALQHSVLAMPAFEAITYLTSFKSGVLALAPYVHAIQAAMSAERFQHDQGLQSYLANMVGNIHAAVQQMQQEQAVAEGRLHHAALQLAVAHARHRRRPRTKALQLAVLVWLKSVRQLSERNESLKQQLAAARAPG